MATARVKTRRNDAALSLRALALGTGHWALGSVSVVEAIGGPQWVPVVLRPSCAHTVIVPAILDKGVVRSGNR